MKKLLCLFTTAILLLSTLPIYATADSQSLAAPTNIQTFYYGNHHGEKYFSDAIGDVIIKWKVVDGADGYQIKEGKNDNINFGLKLTFKDGQKNQARIKMRYHENASFRIRAFKLVDGKKVYGKYTNVELKEKPVNAKTQKVYKEGCLRYVIRFNKAYIINIVNCGKTLEIPEKLQGKTVEGIEMCRYVFLL